MSELGKKIDSSFQCNPALKRQRGQSCLPPSAIERIRRAYNKAYPDRKI